MAKQMSLRIPDLEVRGLSLARRVVSLYKDPLLHIFSLHPGAPIRRFRRWLAIQNVSEYETCVCLASQGNVSAV